MTDSEHLTAILEAYSRDAAWNALRVAPALLAAIVRAALERGIPLADIMKEKQEHA